MSPRPVVAAAFAVCTLWIAAPAFADFTVFNGPGSYDAWSAASGPFTTIDFTGYPQGTLITDQYEEQGILFESSDADIVFFSSFLYPTDGIGINGLVEVEMSFSDPIFSFGMHHPGARFVLAFNGDTLLWTSPILGGGGVGFFSGFTSTLAVDRVLVLAATTAPDPPVFVDNIYFSTVPGPSGAALLALAGLLGRGRRRSRGAVEGRATRCGR
jgi:hypothetical protein